MNKFITNNQAKSQLQQKEILFSYFPQSIMLTDIAETKTYKIKTQPIQKNQISPDQVEEPYINPIVKHTYQSLPKIYGTNINRKKKYNIAMKTKFQLNCLIPKSHNCQNHKDQNHPTKSDLIQIQRGRGHSCLQFAKKKDQQSNQRREITKTALKKPKNLRIKTEQTNICMNDLTHKGYQSVKSQKSINLQLMHVLAKPRQKCSKQYCSCKSLYDQYQQQINKKIRQKSKEKSYITTSRNSNNSRLQLPRYSVQIQKHNPIKLQDRESKHKVNFRYMLNSLQQQNCNGQDCCFFCAKSKQLNDKIQAKGLMGLIRKKQLQNKLLSQNRSKLRKSQTVGIQMDNNILLSCNEDYAAQTNLITPKKKIDTIDQQINTDFEDDNKAFIHLQKNKLNLEQSQISIKAHKKQPLQHLSHLKQKYKYKKRPAFQSKYCIHEHDHSEQCDNCNDEGSDTSNNVNSRNSNHKRKKKNQKDDEQQFDINPSEESFISQTSMANHLANALSANGADRNTIFKLLRSKQKEQSQKQQNSKRSKSKGKMSSNRKDAVFKFIDQQKGLFTIPQEDQYIDYLKSYKPIQKDFNLKSLIKSDNFRILKYKDSLYFGQTQANQVKHGKALFISPKEIFQGVYQNGIRMSGCERNIDGVYLGEFLNGKRHGHGKFIWNNGQIFQGSYKLGTKNGFGIWKNPKGDQYQGQWLLNRQHGKGIFKHKNSTYQGQFVGFYKHGQGKQKFINGDQYNGQYFNGKPNGRGRYVWKNGCFYEGIFKDGLRQGLGIWHQEDSYYQGQFKKDFKHGIGKQTYKNGDYYQGQFSEGIKIKGMFRQFVTGKETQINTNTPRKKENTEIKDQKSSKKKDFSQRNDQKQQITNENMQKSNRSQSIKKINRLITAA